MSYNIPDVLMYFCNHEYHNSHHHAHNNLFQYSEYNPLINLTKRISRVFMIQHCNYLIGPVVRPSNTSFKHRPNNQFVAFYQSCKKFFMKNNIISINEEEIIHPHFSSSIEGFLF